MHGNCRSPDYTLYVPKTESSLILYSFGLLKYWFFRGVKHDLLSPLGGFKVKEVKAIWKKPNQ